MATIVERIGKEGDVSYFVRIRRRGAKAACGSFKRKTDAKIWIIDTEKAILEGRYSDKSEERKHTLHEAIVRYKSEFSYDYGRGLQFVCWDKELGHKLLSELNGPTITEVILKWKKEPNSVGRIRQPASLNRFLSGLSIVLRAASQDWGWCQRNPVKDVRRQKEPRGRSRFLSDEERKALLDACANSYCPYIQLIVVLALSTGMRASEIRYLRWSDVQFDKGVLLLYKTKNKEPRRVPIRGLALELFKEHSKVRRLECDFVFPGDLSAQNGRPFDPRKAWEDARRRACLKDFRFHDLRHSCASYLAMNGASMLEIGEVLGHKTLQMVKRYSHLAESHTANVVEQMNKKIFG